MDTLIQELVVIQWSWNFCQSGDMVHQLQLDSGGKKGRG
jgi:hypothetical protein